MKALSIQQPWCYCITNATKRVENRTWPTHHRGITLLHAGKTYQRGIEGFIHAESPEVSIAGMLSAPRGAIVGYANLVACIPPGGDVTPDQRVWADPAQYKFVFEDVSPFPYPISWRGALGFFEVPGILSNGVLWLNPDSRSAHHHQQ